MLPQDAVKLGQLPLVNAAVVLLEDAVVESGQALFENAADHGAAAEDLGKALLEETADLKGAAF